MEFLKGLSKWKIILLALILVFIGFSLFDSDEENAKEAVEQYFNAYEELDKSELKEVVSSKHYDTIDWMISSNENHVVFDIEVHEVETLKVIKDEAFVYFDVTVKSLSSSQKNKDKIIEGFGEGMQGIMKLEKIDGDWVIDDFDFE
jgi:hypothetical protein